MAQNQRNDVNFADRVRDAIGSAARVVCATHRLDAAGVAAWLAGAKGVGWLQATDAVWWRRDDGADWACLSGRGKAPGAGAIVLDAELWDAGRQTSSHLVHCGADWLLSERREVAGAPGQTADGEEFAAWALDTALVANHRPQGGGDLRLCYRVFWREVMEPAAYPGPDHAERSTGGCDVARPWLSMFRGFDDNSASRKNQEEQR